MISSLSQEGIDRRRFSHTFNALHNANKQIVVTSDRPPKAISSLQDRLRSRFEWGLQADVRPPEYEHRLDIYRSKCNSLHLPSPIMLLNISHVQNAVAYVN